MSATLELLIARHAKSSWGFGQLDDFSRPLSRRGLRDVVRIPKLLAERIPTPDRLLSSTAARAVQTSQALADGFAMDDDAVSVHGDLYLAAHEEVIAIIGREAPRAERVLVVGHNPGLTDLFNYLVGDPLDNLPTLAVAHLSVHAPAWDSLTSGCAIILGLYLPRELD